MKEAEVPGRLVATARMAAADNLTLNFMVGIEKRGCYERYECFVASG